MMAGNGARVLVIERELRFNDRIRGEWMSPWGVIEAQRAGIYELLLDKCAHQLFYHKYLQPESVRDLTGLPALTFYHPTMQEVLIEAAERAGAEVWRGATVRSIKADGFPVTTIDTGKMVREFRSRLVVCADGRSSATRSWLGLDARRASQKYLGAGVMFENIAIPEETSLVMINPTCGRAGILIPQGDGRARGYLVFPPGQIARLQGDGDFTRFVDECVAIGISREFFEGGRQSGPLASFDMTENWIEHPFSGGVALIGDAAGSSDPTWAQGLSITMRDVRVLTEMLTSTDDWNEAGHAYARVRDEYFGRLVKVTGWLFQLLLAQGKEADAIRARALPLIALDPERVPEHLFRGPDLPCDETVRLRLFGEE
jgi:2-polyprenyl-6-methoxyphenol hydroxylase-like FAD-dependent oxidoreductase